MKPFFLLFSVLSGLLLSACDNAHTKEHVVQIITDYDAMRMTFEPQVLVIRKGDTVKWINQKPESHNMVTYPDGHPKGTEGFSSPYLDKAGETWSHTFMHAGTYEYHCIPHLMMGMRGKIIVDTPTPMDGFHVPTPDENKAYHKKLLEFFDEDTIKTLQTSAFDEKPAH